MGLYPQPSAPESLCFGGAEGGGGGGLAVVVCTLPCGGGSPVGAPSGLAENTRWRPLGPWAPSRKNLGFAGGDSAILVWYGMVWYRMVWYGSVWCDVVRSGIVLSVYFFDVLQATVMDSPQRPSTTGRTPNP